jgi:hypothetical protein
MLADVGTMSTNHSLNFSQVVGHCQLIEKIPNKWVKHLTTDLLTPCILVHECQGKSQEIGYLSLS